MTIDKVIRILENTKRNEKTETVGIDEMIEMLNDLKQNQINYKNHLERLITLAKQRYEETEDITDYVRILTFSNAIEFFKDDIEKEV